MLYALFVILWLGEQCQNFLIGLTKLLTNIASKKLSLMALTRIITMDAFLWSLDRQGYKIVPIEADRGDGRMAHYGSGKQPWDTCLELGWAAQGAAFSILRYLRRTKTPERDLKHAKIYLKWLEDLVCKGESDNVYTTLMDELTEAEKERLR